MKKKRITYGVYGMMEYQALIKVGSKATLKVLFTDGSMTALGQNPARFTTSDFIVQHAIENSADFKRGRIKVVSSTELDEEVRVERNVPATEVKAEAPAEGTGDANTPATEETQEPEAEEAAEAPVTETAEAQTVTEVEFSCNADAKEYLETTFGAKGTMRTRADIVAVGKTYGVAISFTE